MSTESPLDCYRSDECYSAIKEAANGNVHAETFLMKMLNAVDTIDDMTDRDAVLRLMTEMMSGWEHNAWVQQWHFAVQALCVVAMNAYIDSAIFRQEGMTRMGQQTGRHLASLWMELIPYVAWTTGGFDHMRKVSLMLRNIVATNHIGQRPKHGEAA